jgi:PST family polysaccharide transporter
MHLKQASLLSKEGGAPQLLIATSVNIIDIIKKNVNTKEKKTLLENFVALSALQGANYILPLITLPYLVRVLGPEKFGLVAFAQAFVGYFQIITDYGFNLSATREISINRENKEKVSEIFSSVMVIKSFLFLLSLIIMSVVIFFFKKFRQDPSIYYITFGMVLGQTIFPAWFFQGMEKMKYITFLNILAKLIFTVAIFVFVRESSDYLYVPLLNSLGFIIAGILALWILVKDFGVRFYIPKIVSVNHQLKEGWYIFISTVAISFYTISNTFILGLFTNNTIVGYYSAAEKLVRALQGLWGSVSQTLYPYFSKLFNQDQKKAKETLLRVLGLSSVITFLISFFACCLAPFFIPLVLGREYLSSVYVFQILVFVIFAVGINNILGIQGLVSFGYGKQFSLVVIIAAIINLILNIVLISKFGILGPAISTISTEFFICIIEYFILKRLRIL